MADGTPLSQREEWADVTLIPQDDGPYSVVKINYSDQVYRWCVESRGCSRPLMHIPTQYKEVMGYFRAVMAKGETSARALRLTADAIALNPANYTV